MGTKISLSNLVDELAEKTSLPISTSDAFLHAFIDCIEEGLEKDKLVKIKGLGTFKVLEVENRESVDVNTGERIEIKGYKKVTFTPDSGIKEIVNRPFAHFEPTELNAGYEEKEIVETEEADSAFEDEATENKLDSEPMEEPVEEPVNINEPSTTNKGPMSAEEKDEEVDAGLLKDIQSLDIDEPVEIVVLEKEETVVPTTPTEEEVATPLAEDEKQDSQPELTKDESVVGKPAIDEKELEQVVHPKKQINWQRLAIPITLVVVAAIYFLFIYGDGLQISHENQESENDIRVEEIDFEDGFDNLKPITPKVQPVVKEETNDAPEVLKEEIPEVVRKEEKVELPQIALKDDQLKKAGKPYVLQLVKEDIHKDIREVNASDTTHYVIDGTLTTHELKKGETIIRLSLLYYGDKCLWPYIVKYNWMKNYDNVPVGTLLSIPYLKNK